MNEFNQFVSNAHMKKLFDKASNNPNYLQMYPTLKVLGKSVGGENAKVPRYEVKW